MIGFLIVVLAVCALLGIGFLAAELICKEKPACWDEWLVISFGLGGGILFLQFFFLSWAGIVGTTLNTYGIVLGDVVILSLVTGKSFVMSMRHIQWPKPAAGNTLDRCLLGCILLFGIITFSDSLLVPTNNWDAVAIWGFKSKMLFTETIRHTNFFHDMTKSYSHPDYPLLVPFLQTYLYHALGHIDDRLVRVLSAVYYVLLLVAINVGVRPAVPRTIRLFMVVLMASIPVVLDEAVAGCADIPLAFYYATMICFMKRWFDSGKTRYVLFAAMFTALAINTKNEGLGLFAINIVAFALYCLINRRRDLIRSSFLYLFVVLILIAPWVLFLQGITVGQEGYLSRLNLVSLAANFNRLPTILEAYAMEFGRWENWNILWPMTFLMLLYNAKRTFSVKAIYLPQLLLLHFGMYTIIYIVTPWDVTKLIETTMVRLLIHIAPLALLLGAEQIGWLVTVAPLTDEALQ